MTRFNTVILATVITCSVSLGAITNFQYVGNGSETLTLTNEQYIGELGVAAADVSLLGLLESYESSYSGGLGITVTADNANADGGVGLLIFDADIVSVSNATSVGRMILGGDGGIATNTGSSILATGDASGGVGLSVDTSEFNFFEGEVLGGNGGSVYGTTPNTLTADGASALYIKNSDIFITKGNFTGGTGGIISGSGNSSAKGGAGVEIDSGSLVEVISAEIVSVGGAGGSINIGTGSANASGGDGFKILAFTDFTKFPVVHGGHYEGGAGGSAISGGAAIADGGNGLDIFQNAFAISNGVFIGGDGGVASNTASSVSSADGGDGFYLDFGILDIYDGEFSGGNSGVANGIAGARGAGLRIKDVNSTFIHGGTFLGLGLVMEAGIQDASLTITNGTFGDAEFWSANSKGNIITISGGTFENLLFHGSSMNTATLAGESFGNITMEGSGANTLSFGGTNSYGDLYLGGTGVNTLSISNGVTSSGIVMVSGATNNINLWNDANFVTTTVSNGVINFNNQNFNLQSGSSFALQSQNARANFNGGATIRDGGALDVGPGQVSATTFFAESGSQLRTVFRDDGSGVTNGLILGDDLTFEQGLTWTLVNDGSATNDLGDFLLASAKTNLTQDLAASDIVLEGNTSWKNGINGVTNRSEFGLENLYATYGALSLKGALGAEGEFGKAMDDLNTFVDNDLVLSEYIDTWTEAEANFNLENSYVRTPEMANAMIGLQAIFADQIKDRTRSHLRLKNFGSTSSSAPRGAAGPSDWYGDTMDWTRDHLPSWDGRAAARSASDKAPVPAVHGEPSDVGKSHAYGATGKGSDYDNFVASVEEHTPRASGDKIEVPETYQVWGRGYGSGVDQNAKGEHVGYNATIAGGILGVDKRFSNLLLGLGAGYARTSVEGNAGNDGAANTGHVVGYFSTTRNKFYFDANLNYAFNDVETEGLEAVGYKGEYNAHTVGFSVGTGYGLSGFNDTVLFTPEVSLLSTYYSRDAYTETSSQVAGGGFPDKAYDAYDQWSYLGALGATVSMIKQIESFNVEMEFQPELRAHWLHEFNAQMDNETYTMVGVPGGGQNIGVSLQAREEDLIKVGGGIRFSQWESDTTEFGIDLDGVIGQDYKAFIVSGKIMHRF